jgi:hypothetical protein
MYTYCATLGGGFAFSSSRWCLILSREDTAGRYGGKIRREDIRREETAGRYGGKKRREETAKRYGGKKRREETAVPLF